MKGKEWKMRSSWLGGALAFTVTVAVADFSFSPAEHFPNIGLTFPRLSLAKADPLPMPETHTFLPANRDDTLTREDRFSPYDLWYAQACCARWENEYGDRLVIGRATHRLPSFPLDPDTGIPQPVTRERFSLELARSRYLLDPQKRDQVNEWVATFVPATVYPPTTVDVNSFTFSTVLCYSNDANLLVYAFLPRRTGNTSRPDWFCVTASMPAVADYTAFRAEFEEKFLSKISLPSRKETKGVRAQEVFPDGKKSAEAFPHSPIRAEARKSVENYDDWWIAETEGYVLLSDVYSEIGKSILRDLQKRLPVFHRACATLLPPLDTLARDVCLIRIFQHREDYRRYVGEEMAWSGAVWMPSRRELVLFQSAGIEQLLPTVQHEAFHQYISFAYAMISPAVWFNEGHACFFEAAEISGKGKVSLEEDPARAAVLLDNLDAAVERLPWVLSASYEEFYSDSAADRLLNYAVAWGICYYLEKGVPSGVSPKSFYPVLENYASALRRTRDGRKATVEAFADVDMAVFQEKFRDFWTRDRTRARVYNPLDK